ncbi:MAG: alkaline phosphatase family protein [Acidimicrobiia bacterium]|nr:alkaline phosphatase family protein [Acidimicrobiia bacterium]
MRAPDYSGGGLVNLAAELEFRLRGEHLSPRLYSDLVATIPDASTYVLALFDGLGDLQLAHPAAAPLRRYRKAALDAAFSTQTTVNLATLATATPPSVHGLVAYLLRFPGRVVNTIWWFDLLGLPVETDYASFLPAPNLPERLAAAGIETVVIQPSGYEGSPLSEVLFRTGTAIAYSDDTNAIPLALEAAAQPGRFVFLYFPHVDAAAHSEGQGSDSYAGMMDRIARYWAELAAGLPDHAVAVGTADHGHVDVPPEGRLHIDPPDGLILHGDSRCVWVAGDRAAARRMAADLPVRWVDRSEMSGWWGPEPVSPTAAGRLPDGALIAEDSIALHYPGSDAELVGYHGGLSPQELRVPLLVAHP